MSAQVAGEIVEEGIKVVAKTVAKTAVKTAVVGAKSWLRYVPFVGAGVSVVCAIREFKNGNIKNGFVDLALGGVGLIPGLNTVACVGAAVVGTLIKAI
jgi:hypothetical protein